MTTDTSVKTKDVKPIYFVLGVILSAISGIMLLLSFPPYGLWPLIWIAFVPYVFAQHRLLPSKWSSLAPAIALLFWLGPYLARIFGDEGGFFFKYLGVWIAIIVFFLQKERKFHELTHYRWFILQGVINWVGFEMIRTFIPMLATNAFTGYTQASQAWLIQPVSIFSIYGMNLVIMLFNFTLAQGAMAWFDRKWQPGDVVPVDCRTSKRWLVGTGITLAIWISISMFILNSAPVDAPTVRMAALQPNFPEPAHNDPDTPAQLRFQVLTDQIREAAGKGAQVIFTPEMGLAFDPQVEHTEELRALASETGAYFFLTYVVSNKDEFRNEAVVLTPSGEFLDVYGKNHAFGEPPTPTAGVYPVYDTPLGRLATMICHDMNYTDVARTLTRNGAQLIAAPIREFGGVGEQLWTNSVFRAVENRVAIVFTGVAHNTALIDPYGRLLALELNPEGERLTLVMDVPLGTGDVPLVRLGDWLGWLSLAGYIFFVVFESVVGKRTKKVVKS
jgi:apolipoprotein N-acyltransferase